MAESWTASRKLLMNTSLLAHTSMPSACISFPSRLVIHQSNLQQAHCKQVGLPARDSQPAAPNSYPAAASRSRGKGGAPVRKAAGFTSLHGNHVHYWYNLVTAAPHSADYMVCSCSDTRKIQALLGFDQHLTKQMITRISIVFFTVLVVSFKIKLMLFLTSKFKYKKIFLSLYWVYFCAHTIQSNK